MGGQVEPVKVLMVSIGGYGYYYLKTLFEEFPEPAVEVIGVVDPNPQQSGHYAEIQKRKIPIYDEVEAFYQDGHQADLVVISSPIQFHVSQSLTALQHGSNVLCDKPLAATIEDADELLRAEQASENWVMIGYQWSYSAAIQKLKRDLLQGRLGKVLRCKTICCWQRNDDYYQRNNWAGKLKDAQGRWVLDSPANNAMAHFLHNLLYLLGDEMPLSAQPAEITAECYRANPIETYDTVACRVLTKRQEEIMFYASHCARVNCDPIFELECERASIVMDEVSREITATDQQGRRVNYGSPDADHQFKKLFQAVAAVRKPVPVSCGVAAARAQTLCVNGLPGVGEAVRKFAQQLVTRDEANRGWFVKNLAEDLNRCYESWKLPREMGLDWDQGTR